MTHISRGWPGHQHMEADCPCPKEPCGFVESARIDPECTEHPMSRAKTIRSMHHPDQCPAVTKETP